MLNYHAFTVFSVLLVKDDFFTDFNLQNVRRGAQIISPFYAEIQAVNVESEPMVSFFKCRCNDIKKFPKFSDDYSVFRKS